MTKIPVFDIGDTLIPSHKNQNKVLKEELERQGFENPPEMDINKYNIYKPDEVQEWLDKNDLDADPKKIKKAYIDWERKYLEEHIIEELKKINNELGPIGFISDNSLKAKDFYEGFFKEHDLDYQVFVVSEEVGVKKPEKEIFQEFLNRRNEPAEKFAYIGNYVDRDIGAEKVGMSFIWLKEHYLFDSSSYEGVQIPKLNFENIENALKEVSE